VDCHLSAFWYYTTVLLYRVCCLTLVREYSDELEIDESIVGVVNCILHYLFPPNCLDCITAITDFWLHKYRCLLLEKYSHCVNSVNKFVNSYTETETRY